MSGNEPRVSPRTVDVDERPVIPRFFVKAGLPLDMLRINVARSGICKEMSCTPVEFILP
ncbi:Uncharacterised protein [Mycobacteroides abscessus subsp. bolletii]|nr:Uncharacterised protein [Mycobacteroides abscessus subsp. bolletii]